MTKLAEARKLVTDFHGVRNPRIRLLLFNDKFDEAKAYVEGVFAGIAQVHGEHTATAAVLDAVGAVNYQLFPPRLIHLLVDSYLTTV